MRLIALVDRFICIATCNTLFNTKTPDDGLLHVENLVASTLNFLKPNPLLAMEHLKQICCSFNDVVRKGHSLIFFPVFGT